jgi:hypothetical protein
MRALAEFVMKERRNAIIAVLLLGLLPLVNLLSPVVVGLTLLRKGSNEALAVLFWALLPMGAYAYVGDVIPLILLLGVVALAAILRQTQSWEFSLLGAVLVGLSVETLSDAQARTARSLVSAARCLHGRRTESKACLSIRCGSH